MAPPSNGLNAGLSCGPKEITDFADALPFGGVLSAAVPLRSVRTLATPNPPKNLPDEERDEDCKQDPTQTIAVMEMRRDVRYKGLRPASSAW